MDGNLDISLDKLRLKRVDFIDENGKERFAPYDCRCPCSDGEDERVAATHYTLCRLYKAIFDEQVFDLVSCEALSPSSEVNLTGIREKILQLRLLQGESMSMSLMSTSQDDQSVDSTGMQDAETEASALALGFKDSLSSIDVSTCMELLDFLVVAVYGCSTVCSSWSYLVVARGGPNRRTQSRPETFYAFPSNWSRESHLISRLMSTGGFFGLHIVVVGSGQQLSWGDEIAPGCRHQKRLQEIPGSLVADALVTLCNIGANS
ncbi:hypothetical protein MLD38_014820 [Melastoma candidum]|uniref:Uncharacterized protein n=1 Tax=Melastoma candidum TaxID=119954 RepID=A0ACB9RMH2_9MYRT|nr:hypothetical protein MLD38_014820 [Melastoma candidum]